MRVRSLLGLAATLALIAACWSVSALAAPAHPPVRLHCDSKVNPDTCEKGQTLEASIEPGEALSYELCVRYPSGRRPCDKHQAAAGKLNLVKIPDNELGGYNVAWKLDGVTIYRYVKLIDN